LLLAAGDECARVDQRQRDVLAESDPRTAVETLADWERVLDQPSTGTTGERQARITSELIRRQRFRPIDFREALAPLLGLTASQVVVIETTAAQAAAMNDPRQIYQFYVYRDPGLGGSWDLPAAQRLIEIMKPTHTRGTAIESIDFVCDDPESLTDRDILGV